MTTANSIPISRMRLATVFGIIILLIIILTMFYFAIFVRPAPPVTIYSTSSVQKLCEIFRVSLQDVFCSDPSAQNAGTFEEMLNRRFPVGISGYDDVMSGFNVVVGNPSYQEVIEAGSFAMGFCPTLEQRKEVYSCVILFSEEIQPMYVYFDSGTNTVTRYIIQQPQRT